NDAPHPAGPEIPPRPPRPVDLPPQADPGARADGGAAPGGRMVRALWGAGGPPTSPPAAEPGWGGHGRQSGAALLAVPCVGARSPGAGEGRGVAGVGRTFVRFPGGSGWGRTRVRCVEG